MSKYDLCNNLINNRCNFTINTLSGKLYKNYYLLFSYNTIIAVLYNGIMYITLAKYGNTTAKHKSMIHQKYNGTCKSVENDFLINLTNLPVKLFEKQKTFDYGGFTGLHVNLSE